MMESSKCEKHVENVNFKSNVKFFIIQDICTAVMYVCMYLVYKCLLGHKTCFKTGVYHSDMELFYIKVNKSY